MWRCERSGRSSGLITSGNGKVTYCDPVTKTLITGSASDPTVKNNETLKLNERVENAQQAQLRAGSHLHGHNMKKCQPEIDLPGTMAYRAGMTVGLSGFGHWDKNNYLVQEATHTLTRQRGYMTSLHLRAAVQGSSAPQQGIVSDEFA
jgi:phage protein D